MVYLRSVAYSGHDTAASAASNLLSNLPMMMLGLATLSVESHIKTPLRPAIYGILIGCNVGPNITIVGSLATMI